MKYRRALVLGGTYFFTVVSYQRVPIFQEKHAVELLREALNSTMVHHPFIIQAAVILPDHIHMIWQLPDCDDNYPDRWRLIKSHFSRHWHASGNFPTNLSRQSKREKAIWQRRYWEHLIRDANDWRQHIDYIHYNPVKHGLAESPREWKYSSFHRFVSSGFYPHDWGMDQKTSIDLDLD